MSDPQRAAYRAQSPGSGASGHEVVTSAFEGRMYLPGP